MADTYWAERQGARWDVYSKERGWMAQADTEDDARLIVAGLEALARPAPVAVPDGYALVPVEPTDDMVRAGAWEYAECKEGDVFSRPAAENIWSQMVTQATLAAAKAAK